MICRECSQAICHPNCPHGDVEIEEPMSRIDELRAALQEQSSLMSNHEIHGLDGRTIAYLKRKIDRALALDAMRGDAET